MSLVHNEQTKLTATAVNGLALAFIVAGAVAPLVAVSFALGTAPAATALTIAVSVVWLAVGLVLHGVARLVLRKLKP